MKQFSEDADKAQMAFGFGDVGMLASKVIFEMSYRYTHSSSTTANRFRFKRIARTAAGKVSSQMMVSFLVFVITRRRGERIRATKDVENNISTI